MLPGNAFVRQYLVDVPITRRKTCDLPPTLLTSESYSTFNLAVKTPASSCIGPYRRARGINWFFGRTATVCAGLTTPVSATRTMAGFGFSSGHGPTSLSRFCAGLPSRATASAFVGQESGSARRCASGRRLRPCVAGRPPGGPGRRPYPFQRLADHHRGRDGAGAGSCPDGRLARTAEAGDRLGAGAQGRGRVPAAGAPDRCRPRPPQLLPAIWVFLEAGRTPRLAVPWRGGVHGDRTGGWGAGRRARDSSIPAAFRGIRIAEAGIGVFAISTFDTDCLLVKEDACDKALVALRRVGHSITT